MKVVSIDTILSREPERRKPLKGVRLARTCRMAVSEGGD
jgi:hypothetical protein